jgi:hypothetical protein
MVSLAQLSLPEANVGDAARVVSSKNAPGSNVEGDLMRDGADAMQMRDAFACSVRAGTVMV